MTDCQIPPESCQVAHIHAWDAEHGPTDLDLLVLWSTFHHTFRHRTDVTPIGDANNLTMRSPDGTIAALPPRGPIHHNTPKPKPKPEPGHQPDLFDDPAA